MSWQERRYGLGIPGSKNKGGGGSGGGRGSGGGGGRGGRGGRGGGRGGGGGGGVTSWGVEVTTVDFSTDPAAAMSIIDISAYDMVQVIGRDLEPGTGGLNWRFTKSGTPVTTAGYYIHVRQQAPSEDTGTQDAVGQLIVVATVAGGHFNFRVEHHNSATIPTLATNLMNTSLTRSQSQQIISDVVEVVDGIEILTNDTNNLTVGVIQVIGYNYPSYSETLISSFDFGTTPANEMITDALATYDEVRVVGKGLTCTNPLQMRLRNSSTDISTANYYSRILVANSSNHLHGNAGFALTVASSGVGQFVHTIRQHNTALRYTEAIGKGAATATIGGHELNLAEGGLETHTGVRIFSQSAANITTGEGYIIGINRGETVTPLDGDDFGTDPVATVSMDALADYHEVEFAGIGVTIADLTLARLRIAGVDISSTNYYRRVFIGPSDGTETREDGVMFGAAAGGTERQIVGKIEGHLSATRPTIVGAWRGEASTTAQITDTYARVLEAHSGMSVFTDDASNITAGTLQFFGIKYL